MKVIKNFIGGQFYDAVSNNFLDNVTPSSGLVYGTIPDSDEEDVALAVTAAKNAFPLWSQTSLDLKFQILNRISDLINENLEALALAESIDNGKPLWLARRVDIPRAASNFQFFATALKHYASESYLNPPNVISTTRRSSKI